MMLLMGTWLPFKFGRGSSPTLSHMCFVDDLILVAEATHLQVNCIKNILDLFCQSSGQKINLEKSQVYFSENVHSDLASSLSQELGVHITTDLGTYLGVPMLHQWTSKQSFGFVLDKMRKKLAGWKANTLSFAGRVSLAQASLINIPGYVFQSSLVPVFVCDEAEKICRDFIWGSTADARKCRLVAWDRLCCPKEAGGLAFVACVASTKRI